MITRLRAVPLLVLTAALVTGAGCKPKAVRGGPGTENPNLDQGAMSTTLDRKDLQDLMRRMKREGFTGVQAHLEGPSLRKQLAARIKASAALAKPSQQVASPAQFAP